MIAEESEDRREVTHRRLGCVDFPVGSSEFMNSDLRGNLRLEEVEATGSDLLA
jgi:hypothetical protein